jgi:uncharacterized glyoxalase superfamily protein PhnB
MLNMISHLLLQFDYLKLVMEEEIDRVFEQLSIGGNVFMPLAEYPFSKKFDWVGDKYGVTWQLNLEIARN